LEQLRHVTLVKRNIAAAQPVDLLAHDVANDDLVPELCETGAGDETDPPGSEDAYLRHWFNLFDGRYGFEPFRDREHRLVRERIEQGVDDPVRRAVRVQHRHVQVRSRVVQVPLPPGEVV